MDRKIKVLIADDHPVFRRGLCGVIAGDSRFEIIGEVGDGALAVELARAGKPDIVVLDIDMPKMNGLEAARALVKLRHAPQIVMLTMYEEETMVNEALDAGVAGYVLKETAVVDILQSLRAVADGKCYLSPSIAGLLMKRRERVDRVRADKPELDSLTPMERRVLRLIAENKTSKEIGAELCISPHTVDTHRRNVALKLELQGPRRLFQFAFENRSAL